MNPAPENAGILILTRRDVRELLDMSQCIEAVERAFRLYGTGKASAPAVASVHTASGGFHMKAGILPVGEKSYFVSKTNGNFPGNPARNGLPTVQGTVVVCDAELGTPLAVMDSIEITALRTAAATAVAARYLARTDASKLAIIGCGLQGEMHLQSISLVRPLSRVALYDVNANAAKALADKASQRRIPVTIASSASEAAAGADLCVTCTTSTTFLLRARDVSPGSFVAGVGVDWEKKRELAPSLLEQAKLVTDVTAQCAAFGDLHHAIDAGALTIDSVHAELGAVVAGIRPGRESNAELIVFDSTGMALQDVAAAALVYERAREAGRGTLVDFAQ